MEEWGERLILLSIALFIPAGILLVSLLLNFSNILLIIGLIAWMGTALALLSPFLS